MIANSWRLGAAGAVAGIAWASALRAYMWFISERPHVDWVGTFVLILMPGAVCGALLGIAEARRRAGAGRGLGWFALAPVVFAVAALSPPGALWTFLTTGLGGGAVAVALVAVGGGFALGQRGPRWARALVGALALALLGGITGTVWFVGGLPIGEPLGWWIAALVVSLLVTLALAASIPFRRPLAVPAP